MIDTNIEICEICKINVQNLKKRKKLERSIIHKYD